MGVMKRFLRFGDAQCMEPAAVTDARVQLDVVVISKNLEALRATIFWAPGPCIKHIGRSTS